jgi:FAD/FMN-containing dehydrogenase
VVVEYYGGAGTRVGAPDTAFPHREAQHDVIIAAQWTDPGESSRHVEWARRLADDMRPFSSGAYLLNALGEEDDRTIKAAFGRNYDRLRAVKKKYDPTNFFRVNQNIEPAV